MRKKGHIKQWNETMGFGVISPAAGGREVFLHIEAFSPLPQRPALGAEVSYVLANGDELRPRAKNVRLLSTSSAIGAKWRALLASSTF